MTFTSPRLTAQGHPPPTSTSSPYPITAHYGYALLWSTLIPANAATLMTGHTVTATIRRNGNQPSTTTPYPAAVFHTYVYKRNGRTGDVLAAELPTPQTYVPNTNYTIALQVTDATGTVIGLSINTTFRFS